MIRRIFKVLKQRKRGLVCAVALVALGAAGFVASHHAMMVTSTPAFCSMCHEIERAHQSWLMSRHRHNSKGVVVKCIDCHLPEPSRFVAFFWAKTHHGVKDIYAHFAGGEYDRERNKAAARVSVTNDRCQRCHEDLLATDMTRGAMLAHRAVLYPKRPGYEKTCHQCHEAMGHKPRAHYDEVSVR